MVQSVCILELEITLLFNVYFSGYQHFSLKMQNNTKWIDIDDKMF